jgi:two-component system, cell cycle response regulator DivK
LKRRVLIVEDNMPSCELLRDWLEVEGFEVWTAIDLKSSLEALAKCLPDVLLLDVNLGHEDGLVVVERMRQEPTMRGIPVIAVTAHAKVTEQQRVLQAGCKACLSKPIDFKALRDQLDHWVDAAERVPNV